MDKFSGATYMYTCKYTEFESLERADIINGNHLLLRLGRGGIDVIEIHSLAAAYSAYGYYWLQARVQDGYVVMNPKQKIEA